MFDVLSYYLDNGLKVVLHREPKTRVVKAGINITIEAGKKYAFIGGSGSGSGKSTALKLLLGYFNDYQGNVMFGEYELRDIRLGSLYDHISYVNQNGVIFEESLKENIRLFDETISDKKIKEIIKDVELSNKLNELESGIETVMTEGGKNFSGGEKQRVNIARALVYDKELIIMDEATSALDYNNYIKIEQHIANLENKTLISVTHRLVEDVLKMYDHLYIFKEGEIVEEGNFDSLIVKEGYFKELFDNQVLGNI